MQLTMYRRGTSAVRAEARDDAGYETARPPGPPRSPASLIEQMQQVFHELHPDGRNAFCAVCDSRYGPASAPVPHGA